MSDVVFAGIARQAEMVRAGDVTPTELVEVFLDRIDRLDPELNAYRIVLAERARADARRVEERLAAGQRDELPMAGVPIARQGLGGPRGRDHDLGDSRVL